MKKKIIFLITIFAVLLGIKNVKAESFYEAEFINGIYMNKVDYSTNTIYYQQARMFRSSTTGEILYCIEPLTFFKENSSYDKTNTPRNLSEGQLNRIKKIIHFGYLYQNHNDDVWYAVTQLMIWRESNPQGGDYYFTETLNGAKTNKYDSYIEEINRLIEEDKKELSINNQTYTLIQGEEKEIVVGKELNDYSTNQKEVRIEKEKILINPLEEGTYLITLTKITENKEKKEFKIYQANDSQTLMTLGNLEAKKAQFQIKVIHTSITIHKVDKETNESTPQGEASLEGTLFQLYNKEMEELEQIEIIEGKGEIKDIPLGTYYIKEIKSGTGYELDDTIYEVMITEEDAKKELIIPNQVIKKEFTIEKTYGEGDPEENISFQIINQQEEVIDTITTDKEGKYTGVLPYGTYTLKQLNTTEGYQLLDPFLLIIHDTKKETIKLNDYKIPVPNTSTNDKISIFKILLQIIMLLC